MIEMEEIKKEFKLNNATVTILKGLSFSIGKGEFVSIMGPSGSGKSTLSSILGCLASPSSGSYKLDGHDVAHLTSRELAKLRNQKIGFIFQDFNLLEGMTAVDNVALPLFYAGVSSAARRKRAAECLEKVGLKEKMGHLPNQLSGGQKQRVAIARALVNEPMFLFADEPTGALDKKTGQEILGLMQKLNFLGHTVVQVTHSPIDATYSKRILHLVDGLIVKDELVDRPAVGNTQEETVQEEYQSRLWRVLQCIPALTAAHNEVIQALLKTDQSSHTLVEATRAIAKWDSPEALKTWNEIYASEHWGVRAEILKSLVTKPKELALPFGFKGLTDSNAWVRYLAIALIKRMSPFPLTPEAKRLAEQALADADERVRATAVTWLGNWTDRDAVGLSLKMAEDKDGRVRANSMDSLLFLHKAGLQSPEIEKCARAHIDDKNNRTRANAAVLLHQFSKKEGLDVLTKMLHSESNLMRASSAWAMSLVGDAQVGALLKALLKTENEELVLGQLFRSLAKLSGSVYPLSEILK